MSTRVGAARRHLSGLAAFAGVMAVTVAISVVARGVVRDQESRLLKERAGEVGVLLTSSLTGIGSSLSVLAGTATGTGPIQSTAFTHGATPLLTGNVKAVWIAGDHDGRFISTSAVGDGPNVGAPLADGREVLARRALTAPGLVATMISDNAGTRLVMALNAGTTPASVVFYESATNPAQPRPSTADSPFRELDLDLYSSPRIDPPQLVVTTRAHPVGSGQGRRDLIKVGADQWLMVTSSRTPLVGSLATRLPSLILLAGLLVAALVALLIDTLVRRRSYALALVEQRTIALRRAQEEAEAANLTKSEFLSRMSHELRTPLNAVLGFGQLLEVGDLDDDQRDSVGHILKGGRHLLDLINEVLDISHIEAGRLALSSEAVLVSEVITDVLQLVAPLAAEQSIHLLEGAGQACDVFAFGDRQRIKQILLNLLSNAIKYNRPRGSVAMSCSLVEPNRVRISVTDTGPGIDPDRRDRLFTPFDRLGAESTDIEGTGIGLALSRRLAEAMGGTIDVESARGRGSTFWVELPLVEGPVERFERLNPPRFGFPDQPTGATRSCVLLIEDNVSNVKLVERILAHRTDLEVVAAMQGRLGLELAREHQPVLILLDLHLPDVDGDEILQRLTNDPATASIPVVIVSADATPRQVQRLLSAGAAAYLTKPIDVRQLLELLDNILTSTAQPRP